MSRFGPSLTQRLSIAMLSVSAYWPMLTHAAVTTDAPGDLKLEEIVVTATRRSTSIQDVPFSISAISGETLRDRGVTDPTQLASLAPSLYVDQGPGSGQTHVGLRGLSGTDFSLGASSPVAIYLDDVYQAFSYGIATQVYDLDRIEVLRGPQGTLFGKNTTGGALLYYSQSPTDKDEGYVSLDGGGGTRNHGALEGALNSRLSDTLFGRLSIRIDRRGSYIDNLYDGARLGTSTNINARAQLKWAGDATTAVLKLYGMHNDGDPGVGIGKYIGNPCAVPPDPTGFTPAVYFRCDSNGNPAPESPGPTRTYAEGTLFEKYETYGATLKVDHNFANYTLTSVSNAQRGRYASETNDEGSAADFFHTVQTSKSWQISQELRVATPTDRKLSGVVGLFGMYDHNNVQAGSGSTYLDPSLGAGYIADGKGVQGTTTLAAFGNINYRFNELLSVVGGLRYSVEHKRIEDDLYSLNAFDFSTFSTGRFFTDSDLTYDNAVQRYPGVTTGSGNPNDGSPYPFDVVESHNEGHTWKKLTWDITGNVQPMEDVLLYGKVATGFRSGGYPVGLANRGAFVRLRPETVTTYEIGMKSEWLNHTLRLNGSMYYMKYKDQQVQVTNPLVATPSLMLQNAAASEIKGVDLDFAYAPTRALQISGSVGWNRAVYTDYQDSVTGANLKGNTLPTAPRWTATFGPTYVIFLDRYDLTLDTSWTYRSRIFFDSSNYPFTSDKARTLGNARVAFSRSDKHWAIDAYVNNLTNQAVPALTYVVFLNKPDPLSASNATAITNTTYAQKRVWGLRATIQY